MTPDLQRARSAIASEIGPDVAEFTPAGEKHFVGEAALLAMGGTFLYAFFKGFVQKAGEAAGKEIGEPVGSALGKFIGGLFGKLRHPAAPPVADADLEAARQEAAAVVKTGGLSPEEIAAIGQAVAASMAAVLAQQADSDVSQRVAERVRSEGLSVLGAAA